MITIDELCQVVASIGLPWAQVDFERGDDVEPPFIVLMPSSGATVKANDGNWVRTVEYEIELYTERRNYNLEAAIATALETAGTDWDSGGYWHLESESMFETVFTVTVRE